MQSGYARRRCPRRQLELRAITLHGSKMLSRYRDDYAAEPRCSRRRDRQGESGTAYTERVVGVDADDPDALRKLVAAAGAVEAKKKQTEVAIKSWCAGFPEK